MGGVLDGFFGRAQDLVIGCGGVFAIGARGSEDLVSELVVGFIGRKAVADPIFEFGCTLFAQELRVDLEQVGPFVRPVIDEPIAADELIDDPIAFDSTFGRIGQKRSDRFGGRWNARKVQGHSPEEVRIVAQTRGLDLESIPLGSHESIDNVLRSDWCLLVAFAVAHDR